MKPAYIVFRFTRRSVTKTGVTCVMLKSRNYHKAAKCNERARCGFSTPTPIRSEIAGLASGR
jgi:hypothetical protein